MNGLASVVAYLEYICQIFDDLPLFLRKFICSHLHVTVGSDFVVGRLIGMCKTQHLVGVVPTCFDVTRHHATGKGSLTSLLACHCHAIENGKPLWKNFRCRPLDCVRGLTKLTEKIFKCLAK